MNVPWAVEEEQEFTLEASPKVSRPATFISAQTSLRQTWLPCLAKHRMNLDSAQR